MLGAAVASAELHLSPSFEAAQQQLMQRIDLINALARSAGLALASYDRSPIFFVQCGSREKTFAVAHRLRSFGIYACISVFPAVADHDAGIRFTVSLHNTDEDIGSLVKALATEVRIAA
jgi:7-keto-8-aminopelargonate synthetase-like enzyme